MTKFRTLSLALTCLLAIGLASCAPTASPDVIVTAPSTVTATLTSTLQPTSTPIPSPTLTFTPTAVKYSAEQLDNMTEEQKIAAAREQAEGFLKGKVITGSPEVEGNTVIWNTTESYTTVQGGTGTREVIAGAWDLESGEWIERVTFDELPDLWDSIEDGEQVYFDGELLTMTTIKDGPLVDAMNVVMSDGEHLGPNEVLALVDTNGEVKVVEFQYVPNHPATEIMSVVKAEAGNGQTLYVVQPLGTEGKYVFDGKDPVTKAEISSWLPPLKQYGGNRVLNNAIDTPGSTFVVVTADPANYPGGWAGVRGDVARFEKDGPHGFTADQRGEVGDSPVIVLTQFVKPEFLKKGEGYRIFVNWENGKAVGTPILTAFMAGAQNPSSVNNLEFGYTKYAETGYFYRPYKQGLWWELFE